MANVISILIQAKDEASSVLNGVSKAVNNVTPSFEQSADASKKLALGLGIVAGAAGGLLTYGSRIAGNLESWKQGFVTLLGSTQKANDALKMIQRDAAATPFEMTGLVQANMLLTSITKDANKSETLLLNVGKALSAMGKGQPELDRIVVNLQQIGAVGHATMVDIRQFAYNGIPIFEMLQKATGKTGDALAQFISDGGVSFDLLQQMFNDAGKAGGRFADAFQNQAGTFNQLLSNMKDNMAIFASNVITQTGVFDFMKQGLGRLVRFLQDHQDDFVSGIKTLFAFVRDNAPVIIGILVGLLAPAFLAVAGAVGGMLWALAPWAAAGGAAAAIAELLVKHFGGWSGTLDVAKDALGRIHDFIVTSVLPRLHDFSDWFTNLPPVVQVILNPIAAIITHLSNLSGFARDVVNNVRELWKAFSENTVVVILGQYFWQVFIPALQAIWAAIVQNLGPALGQLWDALKRLWDALNPALTEALKIVAGILLGLLLAAIWGALSVLNLLIQTFAWVVSAISNVINWISNLISWFGNLVGVVWNAIKSVIDIFANLWPAVKDVVGLVVGLFRGLGDLILDAVKGFGSLLWGAGRDLVLGLARGIRDSIGDATSAIARVGSSAVSRLKGLLGINSPSTVFAGIGQNITQGLVNGITKGSSAVSAAMGDLNFGVRGDATAMSLSRGSTAATDSNSNSGARGTGGGVVINQTNHNYNGTDATAAMRELGWRLATA